LLAGKFGGDRDGGESPYFNWLQNDYFQQDEMIRIQ